MDAIFLDANVLFSAAYRPGAGLLRLWELPDARRLTSTYALEEARRNLREAEQRTRLDVLAQSIEVRGIAIDRPLPEGVQLPDKDRPILLAALHAGATHLITGDTTHFGRYYDQRLESVLILPPGEYLRQRRAQLRPN